MQLQGIIKMGEHRKEQFNFNTVRKKMLSHLHVMVNKKYLAIPKEHDKLITSL